MNFLKISQNLQENYYTGLSFLIRLQAGRLHIFLQKRLRHRWFPVKVTVKNFVNLHLFCRGAAFVLTLPKECF